MSVGDFFTDLILNKIILDFYKNLPIYFVLFKKHDELKKFKKILLFLNPKYLYETTRKYETV